MFKFTRIIMYYIRIKTPLTNLRRFVSARSVRDIFFPKPFIYVIFHELIKFLYLNNCFFFYNILLLCYTETPLRIVLFSAIIYRWQPFCFCVNNPKILTQSIFLTSILPFLQNHGRISHSKMSLERDEMVDICGQNDLVNLWWKSFAIVLSNNIS